MSTAPPPDQATSPNADNAQVIDGRYMLIVGGLLLAIIATLGVLWIRERRSRINLQHQTANLQQALQEAQRQASMAQQMLSAQLGNQLGDMVLPVEEAEMVVTGDPPRREITVLAEAARRVGPFRPGDVIRVAEPIDPPPDPAE
ncbi:MAG: EGFR-like transmembrane domain-containing protein [Phycisphaerae bacterium]